jgi:topoisomerase IV subunit A
LPPLPVLADCLATTSNTQLIAVSSAKRLLAFPLHELKIMAKGRGLQIMSLPADESLHYFVLTDSAEFMLETQGKRGGRYQEILRVQDISNKRGHKGKELSVTGDIVAVYGNLNNGN